MSLPVPCAESDLLLAILRGTVSPADEERIARHLELCEQRRRTVDAIAGFDDGELTSVDSEMDADSNPIALPAVEESYAPELRAVMDHLKEDDIPHRGASATEASDGLTQSLPSGMDAFIQQLVDQAEPGKPATIGHYELGRKIGRGGMGAVYRARDLKLSRNVAIKFLKPDLTRDGNFVERFIREAQAGAGIAHPNVVTVHGIEETNGVPWIVMELIEGESLRKRLRRMGPLTLTSVARIGAQIAEGLQAAHEKRLTHRDIKPSNIVLLEGTDEVRITDFGLAQLEGATRLTKSGLLMGTPKYMAPEQARGDTVDHRSDLFSLGSVLYAMCVGHSPFPGKNDAEVVTNVAKNQQNPIESVDPTLPRWLIDLINKLLAMNPADRFQSASEVAQVLRASLEAGDFADLSTGGEWGEPTPADGSPVFRREVAKTLVEGRLPGTDGPPTGVTALIDVEDPPEIAASQRIRRSKRNQSQNIFIGAGLVALCLLAGFLMWFTGDDSEAPAEPGQQQFAAGDDGPGMRNVKPPDFGEPFVVEQDGRRVRYRDLFAACDQARDNAVIYLEFDGELETRQATIRRRLTLAAGWNSKENRPYRPVLKRDLFDIGNGVRALLQIDAPARLEGIEIRYESEFSDEQREKMSLVQLLEWAIVCQNSADLELVNCRIRTEPGTSSQIAVKADRGSTVSVRNCEFFGGTALTINSSQTLKLENSLTLGPGTIVVLQQPGPAGFVEISNCTCLNESFLQFNLGRAPRAALRDTRIRFDVRNCILDSTKSLVSIKQLPVAAVPFLPSEIKSLDIAATVVWGGTDNAYDVGRSFVTFINVAENPPGNYELDPHGIVEWKKKWQGWDDGSRGATFRPSPGFEGFDMDLLDPLLGIKHSKQLQPELDGALPPVGIGALLETLGPGEGYESYLRQNAENDTERVE